jgi:osmotically-inducible protein OsmY
MGLRSWDQDCVVICSEDPTTQTINNRGNSMKIPIKDDSCCTDIKTPNTNSLKERDLVIAEVQARLFRSPYRELRNIGFEYREGVLILRGQVPSCFLKQIAQSTVFSIERIEEIDNRLEVV